MPPLVAMNRPLIVQPPVKQLSNTQGHIHSENFLTKQRWHRLTWLYFPFPILCRLGKGFKRDGNKKALNFQSFYLSARDWIRTSTPFRAPPPQSGASTNFATRALRDAKI